MHLLSYQNQIIYPEFTSEGLFQPYVIEYDYAGELTYYTEDSTCYYAYQNQSDECLIKAIDHHVQRSIGSLSAQNLVSPILTHLSSTPLLFYLRATDAPFTPAKWLLCYRVAPFSQERILLSIETDKPSFFTALLSDQILICIHGKNSFLLYTLDSKEHCQAFISQIQHDESLQKALASWQKKQELLSKQIEHIKLQYEELQDIATKYQKEAAKWYHACTH